MRTLRYGIPIIFATTLAVMPAQVLANTVVSLSCADAGACYAVITQGRDIPNGVFTLSNLTSATAVQEVFCQRYASDQHVTVTDLWLTTPPDPNGPEYQSLNFQSEWIETGITTGKFQGHATPVPLSFFWARNWWQSGQYNYEERILSGTPSTFVNYTMKIQWSSSGTWAVYRNGNAQVTGIQSQRSPGSHQGLTAGAEMSTSADFNSGEVKQLSDVQSGTTLNGWTGYVYRAAVYDISQNNDHLTYQTQC